MDDADIANETIGQQLDALLSRHRQSKQPTVKDSADNCEDCGLQIPSERQIAVPGCTLCIDCAEYYERVNKHHSNKR